MSVSVPRPRRSRRTTMRTVVLAAAVVLIAAAVQLAALKAAGLTGTAPGEGASAFKQLISTLQSNAVWLIATGLGLVFTLVAGLMVMGSQQAPIYVFRIAGGIAILLVVIPAVLA